MVTSQRECGERAAAAARSRVMAGSSGPSSRLSPARSARSLQGGQRDRHLGQRRGGTVAPAGSRGSSGPPSPSSGSVAGSPGPGRRRPAHPGSSAVRARIAALAITASASAVAAGRCHPAAGPPGGSAAAAGGERDPVPGAHPVEQIKVASACRLPTVWPGNAPDASYCPARASTLA